MRIRAMTWTALLILAIWGSGRAQTGGGYNLTWNSLDCGSPETSSGGAYSLGGTTGQADGGSLAGGGYTLQGGYHQGSVTPTDAPGSDATDAGALVLRLHGTSPNPFAANTAIAFSVGRDSDVQLRIYDLSGRVVRTVLERQLAPGRHQVVWDGTDATGRHVAAGIYFMRLRAGSFEARKKLVLLR
jgi:hypothetical protein